MQFNQNARVGPRRESMSTPTFPLTCTSSIGTLEPVDATTKALLRELDGINGKMTILRKHRDAIYTALALAGIRPQGSSTNLPSITESKYANEQPFAEMSLAYLDSVMDGRLVDD